MTRQMSITEEVYRYLESHPDQIDEMSSQSIYEKLPYLTKNHISSAIWNLESKGIVKFIERRGQCNWYKLEEDAFSIPIKFQCRKKYSHRGYKTGIERHPRKTNRPDTWKKDRHLTNAKLKELYDIKETLLDCAVRLDNLWSECQ